MSKSRPQRIMEQLEDRILFDAVPDGDFLVPEAQEQPLFVQEMATESNQDLNQSGPRELILIDSGVENANQLLDEILAANPEQSFEVRLLNANEDGIEQISRILESSTEPYSAIHVLSHGSDGAVHLGNSTLDAQSLAANAGEIALWTDALTADADILLYGCDLAQSEEGQEFVESLSRVTGTDVAASDDTTGNSELGGNWDLEFRVGEIETSAFVALDYTSILAPPTIDLDVNDSSVAGADFVSTFQPGGTPANITDSDISITDVDGDNLSQITIDVFGIEAAASETVTFNGDGGSTVAISLDAPSNNNNLTIGATTYDIDFDGNTFTITNDSGGDLTTAAAENLLTSTTFETSAIANNERVFEIVVTDSNSEISVAATATLNLDTDGDQVANINDLDDDNDGILDTNEGAIFESVTNTFTFDAIASAAASQVNGQNVIILSDGVATITITNVTGAGIAGSTVNTDNSSAGPESVQISITSPQGNVVIDSVEFLSLNNFDPDDFVDAIAVDQVGTWSNLANQNGIDALVAYENSAAGEAQATADTGEPVDFSQLQAAGALSDILLNPTSAVEDGYTAQFSFDTSVQSFRLFGTDVVLPLNQVTSFDFSALTVTYSSDPQDSDLDGIIDSLDLDSDNDGIVDNIEAQTTAGYIAPTNTYNADGVDLAYASLPGGGLTPIDTDFDGVTDTLDTDSDNDGLLDIDESGLTLNGLDIDLTGSDDQVGATFADVNGIINDPASNLADTFGDAEVDFRTTIAPVVDLDGDDSTEDRGGFRTSTTFGSAAVAIADTDLSVTDADDTELTSITLEFSGNVDGSDEVFSLGGVDFDLSTNAGPTVVNVGGTDFQVIYDAGSGVLTIVDDSGADIPIATVESILAAGTYRHDGATGTEGTRTISVTVSDGIHDSSPVESNIAVGLDTDGDGILDAEDLDDDNDGIVDTEERITATITTPIFGVPENGGSSTQTIDLTALVPGIAIGDTISISSITADGDLNGATEFFTLDFNSCLLYTSPSPRDLSTSRMPSSA